jgi:hypothetical protein
MSDQPQYPSYPGEGPSGQQPPPPPDHGQAPPPGHGQPAYGQPAYGQPAYGQPAYGQPAYGYGYPAPRQTNGKAVASMVVGIVSIVSCYLGVLVGPVAIVLAVMAKKDLKANPETQAGAGMATAGLITGIVGAVLWLAVDALIVVGIAAGW